MLHLLLCLARFAGFSADFLTQVMDPLPFVRLGGADFADVRGYLANLLPVKPVDPDLAGTIINLESNPLGGFNADWMGIPNIKNQCFTIQVRSVTDTVNLKGLCEP